MANRVLIISDEGVDADMLTGVLAKGRVGPFEIERVTHLSTGIDRLHGGGIDAIVTDLALPDSNGIATFDRLFAAAPHTPIMTLGATEDDALAIQTVERGAQGYLPKSKIGDALVPQVLCNIIQRSAVEAALFREKTRAEIALNSIGDAVICTDLSGNIDYLNIAAEILTGWPREEARGHPVTEIFQIVSGTTQEPVANPVMFVLRENKPAGLIPDAVLIRRDGSKTPIEDSIAPIHDWSGRLTGAVVVFHDVSAAREMTQKMAHLAHHDFLTNLPNRVLLNDRIAQAITLAKRHSTQLAVLFLDLDNFKHINDSLGHATGDLLLQAVTERLNACVRSSDTVSRQGGDEFVILLAECKHEQDATLTADKILALLAAPHAIATHDLHVTSSIGISLYPTDGDDAETLIKNADTAMYHAKEKGRNNAQFFRNAMNVRAVERQVLESHLRRALEKNEFLLHYQPIVDLPTGTITGAEALLRWDHAELGLVPPDKFVPIAEDCGLIVPIGRWVLREACSQAVRWMDAGSAPMAIAVNISALEFRHRNFVDGVRAVLDSTGLAPHCLQLEITESVLMRDAAISTAVLNELKDMGVQLAVDDFGTGYSSLSYLQRFPIDILKIDRSFVHDVVSASGDGIIVGAVIGMAKNLGKRVVAEGVETSGQMTFLTDRDCDEGQGYLFSHPLGADAFAALLVTKSPAARTLHPPGEAMR